MFLTKGEEGGWCPCERLRDGIYFGSWWLKGLVCAACGNCVGVRGWSLKGMELNFCSCTVGLHPCFGQFIMYCVSLNIPCMIWLFIKTSPAVSLQGVDSQWCGSLTWLIVSAWLWRQISDLRSTRTNRNESHWMRWRPNIDWHYAIAKLFYMCS